MEDGEEYLSIKMVGHESVSAFPNKEKKGNQPDFKGDGIAIWKHKKGEKKVGEEVVA